MIRVARAAFYAVLLSACGTDTTGGGRDDADATVDSASPSDSAPDTAPDITPDTSPDTADSAEQTDTNDVVVADVHDGADVTPDIEVADATPPIPEVVTCESPSLVTQYPGPTPPFPYGIWPPADGCFAAPHDVIIVLGCPSLENGQPANCQLKRAEMADQLYEAAWADYFIVTGAAVHTPYVEADALFDLLVARGIPADAIVKEPLARHTDENIYYATRIMEARGWRSAIVVSEDPGHLMFTGLCDANCCVALGRMTLLGFDVGGLQQIRAGHYALSPPGPATTPEECTHIANLALCVNIDDRLACKDNFKLDPPP